MRDLAAVLSEPRLMRVLEVMNGAGEETRLVGGAVRNALMGLPVAEVDLATTALPQETIRRAQAAGLKAVPTGIDHGTVTLVCDGTPFEVTTLREDVETDGRHALVRFGRDWRRDAERRDFTMNALFATAGGEVIDLVGGLPDLAARRVRFIGEPEQRIREDYLRILRLFRFHAAYGSGPLDAAALTASIRCRASLRGLSRERIGAEMLKLLAAARAPETVSILSETGLLGIILGGVAHAGALARLWAMEEALALPPDALLRLGVLAVRIAEDADRLLDRLRLSRAAHRRLGALIEARRFRTDAEGLYVLGPSGFTDCVLFEAAVKATDAGLAHRLEAARRWVAPACPIRAERFLARGLAAGPALGAALARAKQGWIDAGFPQDEAQVEALVSAALATAQGMEQGAGSG